MAKRAARKSRPSLHGNLRDRIQPENVRDRTTEGDEHWVDPIIGLRTAWSLGKRVSLILAGDVGGTSTDSQYSAQGVGLIGYRFGLFGQDNANLVGGYRALHQKYEDGDGRSGFDWDVTLHGPIAGLTIAF